MTQLTQWEKTWEAVTKNPYDFAGWEYLIKLAEAANGGITKGSPEEDISNLRSIYNRFLERFPLCYAYWKKLADWELSLVDTIKAEQVYERGLSAVHKSIDLWVHFCSFKMDYYHDPDVVRATFERAVKACGLDFLSHPIWDKYIEYEESRGQMDRVFLILDRVVRIPLHQYVRYFEKFSQLAYTRPVDELVTPQQQQEIEQQVRAVTIKVDENGNQSEKTEEDYQMDIRAKIYELHTKIYMETQEAVHARWTFEANIRRPFYHFKPLDDLQIENWRKYLEFEEAKGKDEYIRSLYERCLVPCAPFEEFWIRYTNYLINQKDYEAAREVFRRASDSHIPITRPGFRMQWAAFEESIGETEMASSVYEGARQLLPNSLEVLRYWLSFKRRTSPDFDTYESEVYAFLNDMEKSVFMVQKAKFLHFTTKKHAQVRQCYKEAVQLNPTNKATNFAYLLFELGLGEAKHVDEAWNFILNNQALEHSAKQMIGKRYLDYLYDSPADIGQIRAVQEFIGMTPSKPDDQKKRSRDEETDLMANKKQAVDQQQQQQQGQDQTGYDWNQYYAYYGQQPPVQQ